MSALDRSLYRSRQFVGALRPRVDAGLKTDAFDVLNDEQQALFTSMVARDQQHCLEVFRALRDGGREDRDLLIAALLHDCGKGRVSVLHRVAFVLLDATAPAMIDRVASPGDGSGWRSALYRCRHHPDLGADLAQEAGSSEATVSLIRGDASRPEIREPLAALEAADDSI